jgi:ribonuclease HI
MELWQTLDEYHQRFNFVQVRWVKGHSGHPQNDFCDQLANRLLNDEGF